MKDGHKVMGQREYISKMRSAWIVSKSKCSIGSDHSYEPYDYVALLENITRSPNVVNIE